ncbi:MAG: hypothetical protein U0264_11820 [Candidatus Kapaibacterium sp.]
MKKYLLIVTIVMVGVLSSCTKNDPVAPGDTNDQSQSYSPMKVGYWWEYTSTMKGYPPTYRFTIGPEEMKNGKSYLTSTYSNSTSKGYFRIENNKIIALGPNITLGIEGEEEYVSIDFNKAIGETIEYSRIDGITGYPLRNVLLMKEKRDTFTTPSGVTYKDIVVLRNSLYLQYPTSGQRLMTYSESYFAKGIGQVYTTTQESGDMDLKDYSFKK